MEFKNQNNILTIEIGERIDTNNAEKVFEDVDAIIKQQQFSKLVLDCEKLEYISSAGLRQLLRLKKAYNTISLVNVNNEVYDILDMTGFTEMLDVKKVYRLINVDGCEKIGEGSNGVVYRINDDTIVKVYRNSDALDDIQRERELARAALVMGINTAISYDVVKVGENYGSMFELLNNKSISKWIISDPNNTDKYISLFTDMLKEIHNTEVTSSLLPNEKLVVLKRLEYLKEYLKEDAYNKLYSLINNIEDRHTMLHGDYHTNNVHYDSKETILIDMDTISYGNPIFEFGNLYNACIGFYLANPDLETTFLKLPCWRLREIYKKTISLYFGENRYDEITNKAKIIGLSRLLRRTLKRDADNKELIELINTELLATLKVVDTLNI